ncbi:DUF1566 domain-containing protein [Pseudoalteromonas sp. MMG005]|uniref:Lcl domain-containing protein n=1 Tax=Pseudoalteromonas sp. MMG005 TaxID=2822682 RepID=UPI001B3A69BF|nr:DUF1566 domain-containing protein [Pseudoalteromonas sp. MMG005]MBQ4845889.1 DUF1566 domain-containing protein [Pseudoalteromonas sp. MMG005]
MKNRLLISFLLLSVIVGYCLIALPTQKSHMHPRYIKISAEGKPLKPWQGPWACVYDKEKQLLWEIKTDNESIHDGYWTYSWYQNQKGVANFGDCYFESNRCDTADLLRHTNENGLCGVQTWRLPSSEELASLVEPPSRPGNTHIAHDFFLHIQHGDYWSSEQTNKLSKHFNQFKEGAKSVNFHTGTSMTLPYRNAAFVMLVSSVTDLPTSQVSGRETLITTPKEINK